jgi:hypothetical protein
MIVWDPKDSLCSLRMSIEKSPFFLKKKTFRVPFKWVQNSNMNIYRSGCCLSDLNHGTTDYLSYRRNSIFFVKCEKIPWRASVSYLSHVPV